jgi:hypothetical protein
VLIASISPIRNCQLEKSDFLTNVEVKLLIQLYSSVYFKDKIANNKVFSKRGLMDYSIHLEYHQSGVSFDNFIFNNDIIVDIMSTSARFSKVGSLCTLDMSLRSLGDLGGRDRSAEPGLSDLQSRGFTMSGKSSTTLW